MIEIQKNIKFNFSLYKYKCNIRNHLWGVPTTRYISQSIASVLCLQWGPEEIMSLGAI